MYANAKIIFIEVITGIGGWRKRGWKRAVEGVKSSKMYLILCKNLCKCNSVPPPSKKIKEKKKRKHWSLSHSFNIHFHSFAEEQLLTSF
jgi:hypothetical protein